MDILLLLARLLLSAVFAVSGAAKLTDLSGSRQAVRGFGIPAPLATPLGTLLPLVELAVALALVFDATAWWGAIGAFILLLVFIVAISANLMRGRKPDCHCFGQLHSAPVSWKTLVRNGLLALLAGFIIGQGQARPGTAVMALLANLSVAEIMALSFALLTLILIGVGGWLLLHVLQQQGRLLLRIEALETALANNGMAPSQAQDHSPAGLPIGAPAPDFTLPNLDGEQVAVSNLLFDHKPLLLVFSDPGCGPCTALLPDLARWQHELTRLTTVIVSRGTLEANHAKQAEHGLTHVLLQQNYEVSELYQAAGTPSAVLINSDGTIGSALAAGAHEITALVARTAGMYGLPKSVNGSLAHLNGNRNNGNGTIPLLSAPAATKIGKPAPQLRLPDLTGKLVDLVDFRGNPTLLLFWNPDCGFCQRMVADLKAWESVPPQGAPKLLIVSTGTVEANKAMELSSPIVLDQDFSTGSVFGAGGTPMAVLIDADGNIGSEVAAGASAVFALAAGNKAWAVTK